MYSKLSHTTISSRTHGAIATRAGEVKASRRPRADARGEVPTAATSKMTGPRRRTTERARLVSDQPFPRAASVLGAPLSDARDARRAKRPPPCRNARVAPISRTRWRSSSASPRASLTPPARGSLRPREDPALTRHLPLPSRSPPHAPRRKVQQQSAKIQIDASRDRARLDAKANAQQERLKAMAEAEARERAVRLSRGCRPSPIRARRVPRLTPPLPFPFPFPRRSASARPNPSRLPPTSARWPPTS